MQTRIQCFSFYSCLFQKSIQQIGLEYELFSQIVQIKRIVIGETDTASKENKRSIFKFEGRLARLYKYFLLKTTDFKIISRQDKIISPHDVSTIYYR